MPAPRLDSWLDRNRTQPEAAEELVLKRAATTADESPSPRVGRREPVDRTYQFRPRRIVSSCVDREALDAWNGTKGALVRIVPVPGVEDSSLDPEQSLNRAWNLGGVPTPGPPLGFGLEPLVAVALLGVACRHKVVGVAVAIETWDSLSGADLRLRHFGTMHLVTPSEAEQGGRAQA